MKQYIAILIILLSSANMLSAQITDNETVGCSASLETLMRVQVTSGGNIEFVFNTIDQLTNGIDNTARYRTNFTISSSVNYNVLLYTDDANLIGADKAANILALNNVGYTMQYTGAGLTVGTHINLEGAGVNPSAVVPLTNAAGHEAVSVILGQTNYGSSTQNAYTINWECGTSNGTMNPANILSQSIAEDRYITNVFILAQFVP